MNFEVDKSPINDGGIHFPRSFQLRMSTDENLNMFRIDIEKEICAEIMQRAMETVRENEYLEQLATIDKNIETFLNRRKLLQLNIEELQIKREKLVELQPADLPDQIVAIDKELSKAQDEQAGNESALEASLQREKRILESFRGDCSNAVYHANFAVRDQYQAKLDLAAKKLMEINGVPELIEQMIGLQFKVDTISEEKIAPEDYIPDGTRERKDGVLLGQFELDKRLADAQKRHAAINQTHADAVAKRKASMPPSFGVTVR